MGILIPSKVGLVLRAPATVQQVADAVGKAATVEPPFAQRKFKYRSAPGIGAGSLQREDPAVAVSEHGLSSAPQVVLVVDLCGALFRVWLDADRQGVEARFICVHMPIAGVYAVDGFPWAEALAQRTAEFLGQGGIQAQIEVVKARG